MSRPGTARRHLLGLILLACALPAWGRAAEKPAWVEPLFTSFRHVPANRLRLAESATVPGKDQAHVRVLAEYTYRDPAGKEQAAKAKLFLPDLLRRDPKARVPLYYSAGYEIPDPAARAYVDRGWAVVSPAQVSPNPLVRTANPDIALLHIARALPFVADAQVVVGGGSAGGYMTLMLAAETFPLAGAAPDVPPVNWGYNGAYFFTQMGPAAAAPPARRVPVLAAVGAMLEPATKVYGTDYGDATWFRHSPLGHVPTITCPVSVLWSTADVLVPVDQIGGRWVRPFDPGQFPDGFTMDPARLTRTREGRLRLTDVLAEADYEAFDLPVPAGAVELARAAEAAAKTKRAATPQPLELPVSATKQWSVAVLGEGPPEPGLGHFKYLVAPSRDEFLRRVVTGTIPAGQLTPPKLERLMDRYAHREWLPTELKHLDDPASERADVLRGLRTYVTAGPDNAATFARLYGRLPPAKQVLEPDVLRRLGDK